MPNFSDLTPEELAQYDKVLNFLETANTPTKEGAAVRAQIEASGGIDPEKARAVGQYRAWKYKLDGLNVDKNQLINSGVPADAVDVELNKLLQEQKDKIDSTFMHFAIKDQPKQPPAVYANTKPVVDTSGAPKSPNKASNQQASPLDNTILNLVKFVVNAPKAAKMEQDEYQGREDELQKKLQKQLVNKLLPAVKTATASPDQLDAFSLALGVKNGNR